MDVRYTLKVTVGVLYLENLNDIACLLSNGFHWAAHNGHKSNRSLQKIE
jgi:hypothetical protein